MTVLASTTRRAFSLIELLMAIFILGIGLISIASLFPAGISLQQRAEDEINGPIVASRALDVLRGRLSAEDFGSWRDFFNAQLDYAEWLSGEASADQLELDMTATLVGELDESPAAWLDQQTWPWMRPAMITSVTDSDLEGTIKPGTVDVFNSLEQAGRAESIGEHTLEDGHPWKRLLAFNVDDPARQAIGLPFHPRHIVTEDHNGLRLDPPYLSPPEVLITPEERTWPPADGTGRKPLYFWDFMVRRHGTAVQVAVFVYRVKRESISQPSWVSAPVEDHDNPGTPFIPVPWVVDLNDPDTSFAPWWAGLQEGLPGTEPDQIDDINDPHNGWVWPGQWLVDQMGGVHRIAAGRTSSDIQDGFSPVSLTSPVPAPSADFQLDRLDLDSDGEYRDPQLFTSSIVLPASSMATMNQSEHFRTGMIRSDDPNTPGAAVIDRLWYVPPIVTTLQEQTYRLVPIYVTVADL
ncbi:MAG: prepilin-type N-terminal cleavage/methylation domain-containing protein [Phycisphaerales bacterium]|jgi:prepilin-type N-terminal cleavage/methylation domain-containing protein|nr:prepilin-type N-terminal cleavage/methylation domain-containing protein [Phycisphaerales bacterium]